MNRSPVESAVVRIATISLLFGVGVLLEGCLVATVAGAAADVGVAAVKTTVAVGKAIIPLNEPGARGQAQP